MIRAVSDLRREILSTVSAALTPSDHEMIHTLARETGKQASLEALLPLILTKPAASEKPLINDRVRRLPTARSRPRQSTGLKIEREQFGGFATHLRDVTSNR